MTTPRDPRHRIGLHHSNHLIDVMDTWPATRRRRFPFGLRRDVKGWVVSDEALARGDLSELNTAASELAKIPKPGPIPNDIFGEFGLFGRQNAFIREYVIHGYKARLKADWKATQYAEYRIKRGYVSPLSKEERLK